MSEVNVFVDDAVTGTLPLVCAKHGVATGDRVRIAAPVGDGAGLGVAWLLVLAGPLGWLALLVLGARAGRSEVVTVEVPMSEPAYQELLRARRQGRGAAALSWTAIGAGIVLGYLGAWADERWFPLGVLVAAIALGGAVAWSLATQRTREATVGVELDGSRRWVTLSRVHPNFVAACTSRRGGRVGDSSMP